MNSIFETTGVLLSYIVGYSTLVVSPVHWVRVHKAVDMSLNIIMMSKRVKYFIQIHDA